MGDEYWNLRFLNLGVLVACPADDPRLMFSDAEGQGWKPRKRERLVQPDNMDERAPHTVVYRDVGLLLSTIDPEFRPASAPEPDNGLEPMPIYPAPPEPMPLTDPIQLPNGGIAL